MTLTPGTTLGPYDVLAKIGEGGMGEVYRARDTKLDRDVALKVLPEAFTADPERLARFEREAKVLASLNHPNIGHIYGLEEAQGTKALVLELIDGPTLADRIAEGPIPLEDVLPIATQIAEALEAAHEQGVIHRDLKPANVKVKTDGTVKVLDFGLAKALQPDASDPSMSLSPTISLTAAATQLGMVIGTAAYMAPEQAKGKAVDRRADIWAFGAVLYEMLTGRRAFAGGDISETLAFVITKDVDWAALPTDTPDEIRQLLRRCLERDPRRRLRDIGEARIGIDRSGTMPAALAAEPDPAPGPPLWQRPIPAVIVALGLIGLGALVAGLLTPSEPRLIVRTPIPLGPGEAFTNAGRQAVAISPDGSQIVYTANLGLSLRPVDQLSATVLPGTDETGGPGAPGARNPFFSPDSLWIGYQIAGQLKKISVTGGAPVTLCEADQPFGASWGADDMILFGLQDGIWQVPGTSGTPEQLIPLDEGERAHGPQMLPGGDWVLFTLADASSAGWDDGQIVAQSVATGVRRTLIPGRDGRYIATGHLVYLLNGVLLAVPFDPDDPAVSGGSVPLVQRVRAATSNRSAAAHFSVADNGSLVYIPGGGIASDEVDLVWVDRNGQQEAVGVEPGAYGWARVSPDGTRLALDTLAGDNLDVWIYDLTRNRLTRLTFDEADDGFPLWTPDSARVVFQSTREGGGLFWKAADGTGDVERLIEHSGGDIRPYGWSADGRLVFDQEPGDIGILNIGDGATQLLLAEDVNERQPALSPDGRWIAYGAGVGRPQVLVKPFPNVDDGLWQVSSDGGNEPVWAPDSEELFFMGPNGFMAAAVETEPTFNSETPEVLFDTALFEAGPGRVYDIAPDGDRFLMKVNRGEQVASGETVGLVLVRNWFRELKERVPVP